MSIVTDCDRLQLLPKKMWIIVMNLKVQCDKTTRDGQPPECG